MARLQYLQVSPRRVDVVERMRAVLAATGHDVAGTDPEKPWDDYSEESAASWLDDELRETLLSRLTPAGCEPDIGHDRCH